MSATYIINTLQDMLTIPADRRGAFLKELELSLALVDLVADPTAKVGPLRWTDDGDHSVSLTDAQWQAQLTLEVRPAEAT